MVKRLKKAEQPMSEASLRQLRGLAELLPDDFSMVSEGRRYGKAEALATLDRALAVEEAYQAARQAYFAALRAARAKVPEMVARLNEVELLLREEEPELYAQLKAGGGFERRRRPVRKGLPARRLRKRPKPETK